MASYNRDRIWENPPCGINAQFAQYAFLVPQVTNCQSSDLSYVTRYEKIDHSRFFVKSAFQVSTVYATTGGSPYVYRNFMVCTQRMGDNEMRRPRVIGRAY